MTAPPNAARPTVVAALVAMVGACASPADYMKPPREAVEYGSGEPIYTDQLKVDSDRYPAYRASRVFVPPNSLQYYLGGSRYLPQTELRPTDIWHVTHVFHEYYIIQSETYNDRQCRLLDSRRDSTGYVDPFNRCLRRIDWGVFIRPDGTVAGSWALLPGPRLTFSTRKVFLYRNPRQDPAWPRNLFVVHHAP